MPETFLFFVLNRTCINEGLLIKSIHKMLISNANTRRVATGGVGSYFGATKACVNWSFISEYVSQFSVDQTLCQTSLPCNLLFSERRHLHLNPLFTLREKEKKIWQKWRKQIKKRNGVSRFVLFCERYLKCSHPPSRLLGFPLVRPDSSWPGPVRNWQPRGVCVWRWCRMLDGCAGGLWLWEWRFWT